MYVLLGGEGGEDYAMMVEVSYKKNASIQTDFYKQSLDTGLVQSIW